MSLVKQLKHAIDSNHSSDLVNLVKQHHFADIADALEELNSTDITHFFSSTPIRLSSQVLTKISLKNQLSLIQALTLPQSTNIIADMPINDAAYLLEELHDTDSKKATTIINNLTPDQANEIKQLLAFPEHSAGSLMTSEYVSIPENLTAAKALSLIKNSYPPNSTSSFFIFIVNKKGELKGYSTLRNILLAPANQPIREIRKEYPVTATTKMDQEDVAKAFQKYNLVVIPVINRFEKLVGIITIDEIVDVVIEEATEDMIKLSGTSEITEEKLLSGKISASIFSRLPWLLLTIIGGLIAAWIISYFSTIYTVSTFPLALLLSFVPLLMGLGGNVGNQSATIFVRGLSTGLIKPKSTIQLILREGVIGAIIGLILSLLLIGLTAILNITTSLSLIVASALFINIVVASLIGASFPLIFKHLNIDPAVASAPFISMTLDIISQLIYFSLSLGVIQLFQ